MGRVSLRAFQRPFITRGSETLWGDVSQVSSCGGFSLLLAFGYFSLVSEMICSKVSLFLN